MSNFQNIDNEEIEQDELKEKLDLITITSAKNLDTLTGITDLQADAIIANTLKNTYPSADATKVGLITITSNKNLETMFNTGVDNNTNILSLSAWNSQQQGEIDNIEAKTDYLTIDANTFKYGKLIVGEQSPSQLILQHGDINSGNLSTTDYTMRVTANGELRLNVPTGQDYEFRINNVFQYNNTQIKNLIDNVSVSQNVDLDTIESDVTGIKNNTLASTLKTAVDANTSLSNANQIVVTAFGNDVTGIKNNTLASTLKTNVDANSAKVSSQWSNNGSEVYINENVGIKTTDPNSDLEIGDGTANIRVRLNGLNSQANSSEIIFTDARASNNPEYYQGATIRFNSANNKLSFMTDQGNDNTPEEAMAIVRNNSPYVYINNNLDLVGCSLLPLTKYCYGRRVRTATDTDNDIELSTSETAIIYNNILTNGITYNTSTGFFSVSTTGLYHVVATLQIDCGTGPERQLQLLLKNGTTNVLKARTHVSRAEGDNSTAMQFNMNAPVRLATGLNYNFTISSQNTGTGVIQNDLVTNNSLMIKGLVLNNSTTIPSNWGEANT